MTKEELIELRRYTLHRVEVMRKVGDYGAGAADNRENGEALLQIVEHLIERLPKPKGEN